MARKKRIHIPGAFYHITQRGNARQKIFFDDKDRTRFCLLMQEGVERFGHKIHGFALMGNHFHLLLQAGENPPGKAMQNLTFRFSRRLNRKFRTTGHRFQGRYYAGLIEADTHLNEVLKYIHLNPVRANMVKHPADYCWSSHNHYISKNEICWIVKDLCLQRFSHDRQKAISKYKSFMEAPQSDENISIISGVSTEYYIGCDDFIEKMQKRETERIIIKNICVKRLSQTCCTEMDEEIGSLLNFGNSHKASFIRGLIGHIILHHTELSLNELAKYTNKSPSTISRSVKKIAQTIEGDPELKAIVARIVASLKINAKLHH